MSAGGRNGLYLAAGVMLLAAAGFIETFSAAHGLAFGVGLSGAFVLVGWASSVKRLRSRRRLTSG